MSIFYLNLTGNVRMIMCEVSLVFIIVAVIWSPCN